jgi:hypothetical protein
VWKAWLDAANLKACGFHHRLSELQGDELDWPGLIAATTTTKGLRVRAAVDPKAYPTAVRVDPADLERVRLIPARFHGDWNYTVNPTTRTRGPAE